MPTAEDPCWELAVKAAESLYVTMMLSFPRIKHNGFAEEDEWRIVVSADADKCRSRPAARYLL
jgi:hypothetical protein